MSLKGIPQTPEEMRAAKEDFDMMAATQMLRATFYLTGFGWATIGMGWLLTTENSNWLQMGLAFAAGWVMTTFAWRFVKSLFRIVLDLSAAAVRGAAVVSILKKEEIEALDKALDKALDNWDCGDPSCKGCSEGRKKKEQGAGA